METRSHGVDIQNCLRSNFRRELHRLPLPTEWSFPFLPIQDRLTLWCWECVTENPRKGSRRFKRFRLGMYRLSQTKHRYTPFGSEDVRGFFSARVRPLPFWQYVSPMEEEKKSQHGSSQPFIAWSGLTLVTHATTRVPATCVPPAIWKSHVLPKRT
jgi:hypothetical protein